MLIFWCCMLLVIWRLHAFLAREQRKVARERGEMMQATDRATGGQPYQKSTGAKSEPVENLPPTLAELTPLSTGADNVTAWFAKHPPTRMVRTGHPPRPPRARGRSAARGDYFPFYDDFPSNLP